MDLSNPLYKNQGIHVDIATFTVENGSIKVLLIRRDTEPFVGYWGLPGGAVYNNESVEFAAKRELKEKTGLIRLHLHQFHAFSDPTRDPRMRMISIGYLALIDKTKVSALQRTPKATTARWFDIKSIPLLAFDHKTILDTALVELRKGMLKTNNIKGLLPEQFTLTELQRIYESIFDTTFDRRNFRRKFLSLGLIEPTGMLKEAKGCRPANYYRFTDVEYSEFETI